LTILSIPDCSIVLLWND